MSKIESSTSHQNSWEKIHKAGGIPEYYNMEQVHPDLDKVIAAMLQTGVSRVLDVGCGTGNNMHRLLSTGFNVFGIDISPTAISEAKNNAATAHLSVGTFQQLPYDDNTFDGIISIQTLSHGKEHDIEKGFCEIDRVTRSGGLVFITVPGRVAKGETRFCLVKTAKQIEPRVYVPTQGSEVDIPHYIFNKKIISHFLHSFTIEEMWRDHLDYYSVIARKI